MIALRPSGSHIWTKCAAAPLFQSRVPKQPDTDATREGTCAAWVAECVLTGEYKTCDDMIGVTQPENGWLVTDDMTSLVQDYCDMLTSRGYPVYAELKVRLNELIEGTLDAGAVAHETTLFIDDLKFGYGPVDAFENTQLIIYAAALIRVNNYQHLWVSLGIFQPRAIHNDGSYRTWVISRDELLARADWIIARGDMCQLPNPTATPGDHCKHCEANASCMALAGTVYDLYTVIESQDQVILTPENIGGELDFLDRALKLIEARKLGVTAEAEQMLNSGQFIQGWGIITGLGRRKFVHSPEIIEAVTGLIATKVVPLTPSELENSSGSKAATKRTVKLLTTTPTGRHHLGRVKPSDIAKHFSGK